MQTVSLCNDSTRGRSHSLRGNESMCRLPHSTRLQLGDGSLPCIHADADRNLSPVAQSIAEKIIEFGDRVNLLGRFFQLVVYALEVYLTVIQNHIG